jgi:hypothetical protein
VVLRGTYSELSICIVGDVQTRANESHFEDLSNKTQTSNNQQSNSLQNVIVQSNAPTEINVIDDSVENEEKQRQQLQNSASKFSTPWIRRKGDFLYDIHKATLEPVQILKHPPVVVDFLLLSSTNNNNKEQTTTIEESFLSICQKAEENLNNEQNQHEEGLVINGVPSFYLNQLFELFYKERQRHQFETNKSQQHSQLAYFRWRVGLTDTIIKQWVPKLYGWLTSALRLKDTNTVETALSLITEFFLTFDLRSFDLLLVCLFSCLFVCLFVCLFNYLFIYLFVYLFCLFIYELITHKAIEIKHKTNKKKKKKKYHITNFIAWGRHEKYVFNFGIE